MLHAVGGGHLKATAGRVRLRAANVLVIALVLVGPLLGEAAPAGAQTVEADLALSATATPSEPHFNELTLFAFEVTNSGPDVATNTVVSGSVPSGVQVRSLTCDGGSGSFSGSPITGFSCTYSTFAVGDTRTVSVRVDADVLGAVTASASVASDVPDLDSSDNTASATAHVRPANADIGVAVTAPLTAAVGDTFVYRLTVDNDGPENVKAARGTLALPAGVSDPVGFVFPGGVASCVMPGATRCAQTVSTIRPTMKCWSPGEGGAHTVTCEVSDGGLIGPTGFGGTGQTAHISVEALQAGQATATATTTPMTGIDDPSAANNTSTAGTLVVEAGELDLRITKSAPSEARIGGDFDYTIVVRNLGPIPASGVTMTDTLPAGVTLVSASGSGVTCTGTSVVSCDLGSLTVLQSRQITIRVTAVTEGSTTNTATVSSVEPDADASNNSSSATVLLRQSAADISVTPTGPTEEQVSRNFTLSLAVRNNGPDATSNVRLRGALPAGLALSSSGNFDCFAISTGFECFVGSLSSGLSDTLQVRLVGSTTGLKQVPITVTQAQPDPDATNNEPVYEVEIVPRPEADVSVDVSLPASVEIDQLFDYTVTASNAGPDPARVIINSAFHEDAFIEEVATSPLGSCSVVHGSSSLLGETAAIVLCSLDPLAPGDSWTVTVTLRAVEGGTQPVTGQASASIFDPDGSNNTVLTSIEVLDNEPPDIEAVTVPSSVYEGSEASATGTVTDPDGDPLTLTASLGAVTDNGDGTWSWSYLPADGPDGPQTVTITAEDPDGEQDQVSFDLGVANVAPTVELAGDGAVDEGATYSLTLGDVTDPGDDTVTEWVVDWGDGTVESFAAAGDKTHVYAEGPADVTIAVDLVDEDGTHEDVATKNVTVTNVAPAVGPVSAPVDPVLLGGMVEAQASFSDSGAEDTHTATWDWGDGTSSPGVVDATLGTVAGHHTYAAAGVYTVAVTVTDDDEGADTSIFEFVVVYDPEGGFVTGGGSVHSPEGAYPADPSLTGRATFGFVSKYKKGAVIPTGNTQFQFKAASLNFASDSYEWLVISGATARYKGVGTINGEGGYGFLIDATDGQVSGGGGQDRFRIKIWDRVTGETVYDNKVGGEDAVQGSIVIHK